MEIVLKASLYDYVRRSSPHVNVFFFSEYLLWCNLASFFPSHLKKFFFFRISSIYLRERARMLAKRGGWGRGEGEGQADFVLRAEPHRVLSPTDLRP